MAEISAQAVKQLREQTGAGMMDCKKALVEVGGDPEKAVEWLRKKGLASAEKKAGRATAEGLVYSYIHTGDRIGVLLEINCETDFVARREEFRQLAKDIAMQIAALPVSYVEASEIPAEVIEREKAIEMGREDLAKKPDNIKEKIVQGRVEKLLKERCLLEQPFVKDPNLSVGELIKQKIALLGENIKVRRFVRFVLGEDLTATAPPLESGTPPAEVAPAAPEPEAATPAVAENPAPEPTGLDTPPKSASKATGKKSSKKKS
ncbi:MAG: translation elongation factor Ts [Gloeomargaritaceae cyanobacterium C42_A2020_066]|nr:translation elongation factor Ts [Gloeomargaritaceae cyanobacterium C42_A2020_066]